MNVDLEVKEPHPIQLEEPQLTVVEPVGQAEEVEEAEELLTHINSSYTLNDYCCHAATLIFTYLEWGQKIHKG